MKPGPTPGVYLWRNQTYIGVKAVAAAAGVRPHVVSTHLAKHGNLDQLGTGRGRHRSANRTGGQNRLPVSRFGRSWPSLTALACELGRSISTVRRWLANDDDRLLAALMAADARRTAAALRDADMIDRINKRAA